MFVSGIAKLNALAPDLVMSVGDLIGGHGKNSDSLTREWVEFDRLVRRLDAPFFYVAGNHDIDDPIRRQVWRERYGPTHYAFVYDRVLFVCLDTIDPGIGEVRPEQLAWLEGVLGRHTDVEWTFLFMHYPLWETWRGLRRQIDEPPIWKQVSSLLGERPYTAFAGHHHRYVKHERDGRSLYTLATTGGVSSLRGLEYGEFDHIAWVTVTDQGPIVANLTLDAISGDAPRSEAGRVFEEASLGRGALQPTPIYFSDAFRGGRSKVEIRNDGSEPMSVELATTAPEPFGLVPAAARVTVAPHSTIEQSFEVLTRSPWVAEGAGIDMSWRARSKGPSGERLELSGASVLPVVRVLPAPRVHQRIHIDGRLDDWGALPIAVDVPRQVLGNAAAWRGPEDNRFRLGMAHDGRWFYLAVDVADDAIESKERVRPWTQDGVEIRLDARPDPVRARSGGAGDGEAYLRIAISPSRSADAVWLYPTGGTKLPKGTELACVRTSTGYVAEIAIPKSWITRVSGDSQPLTRINVAVYDRDRDGQSVSWWWPDWRSAQDLPGSGTIGFGR